MGLVNVQGFFVLMNVRGFVVWEAGRKSKAHSVDFLS